MIPLTVLEEIIDASGVAPRIEALLPIGVRARQLSVRTLLAGMCLTQADGRPAHLTRVHQALTSLPADDQRRLGVIADWRHGPHLLTYRQTERTSGLVTGALAEDEPDGLPSGRLQAVCDDLLEASVPGEFKDASRSLAVDRSDLESFSRPPAARGGPCADPEASWGHRKNNLAGPQDELFYGYYLSAAIMTPDEQGPAVPEFARRATLSSCRHDPVPAFVPVLTAMPAAGIPLGDVLADSGYAYRVPQHWAAPLRTSGAALVQDLHPHDRGPKGTCHGAIIANGCLYCPCTPRSLLELGPLARSATPEQAAAHDAKTAEAARYKLGRITCDDEDGYHRVMCPAATGKIRCPLRPASMTLDRGRPEILTPPENPPACCTQQTITIPPDVLAKTAQKHDYPSKAHRQSYARRTGAERGFATAKDPATNDISRGWCRLTGLTPLMLAITCLLVARNQRILTAWNARQQDNARRAAAGLPREPAGAAARPSPRSRPYRHNGIRPLTPREAPQARRHPDDAASACPQPAQTRPRPPSGTTNPHERPGEPECQMWREREDRPHRNVKTSWWSGAGSNCRPSAFQEVYQPESTYLGKAPTAQLTRIGAAGRLFSVSLTRITSVPECAVSSVGFLWGSAAVSRSCGVSVGRAAPRRTRRPDTWYPDIAASGSYFPGNPASPERPARLWWFRAERRIGTARVVCAAPCRHTQIRRFWRVLLTARN
jgi:hypothetical protein